MGPQPTGTPQREYEPTGRLEAALRIAQSAQTPKDTQNLAAGDPAAFKRFFEVGIKHKKTLKFETPKLKKHPKIRIPLN